MVGTVEFKFYLKEQIMKKIHTTPLARGYRQMNINERLSSNSMDIFC